MTSNKRIISFILPDLLPLAGVEVLTLGLIEEFSKKGYALHLVLINEKSSIERYVSKDVQVINFKSKRLISSVFKLSSYFRNYKPNYVISAMWPLTLISIISKIISRSKLRLVISDHNPLSMQYKSQSFLFRILMKLSIFIFYRAANAHISVSSDVKKDLVQNMSCKMRNMFVINNLVNTSTLDIPGRVDHKLLRKISKFDKVVITVGRLKIQKNHKLLIDSFGHASEMKNYCLLIVGEGELYDETQDYIIKNNLDEKIFLVGHHENIGAFYKLADLFVLSSNYEGFGNVLVEALSHGLPIVSVNCVGGPKDILRDGQFGILTPKNKQALSEGINKILSHEVEFDKDKLLNRANDFSSKKISNEYLKVLEKI